MTTGEPPCLRWGPHALVIVQAIESERPEGVLMIWKNVSCHNASQRGCPSSANADRDIGRDNDEGHLLMNDGHYASQLGHQANPHEEGPVSDGI